MYKHKTMFADSLPSAEQLDEFSSDGWEMFHIVPSGNRFVIYLRRMKAVS